MLLLAAALAHLAVLAWSRLLLGSLDDPWPIVIVRQLPMAMPFALAAGLAAGWDRWPPGRRWLVAACVALSLSGAFDAIGQIWVTLVLTSQVGGPQDLGGSTLIDPFGVLHTVVEPLGFVLAAIGLWRSAPRVSPSPRHRTVLVTVAAIAAGVLLARAWIAAVEIAWITANSAALFRPIMPWEVAELLVYVVGGGAVALVGVAAVRAAPRRYYVPELLIAVGATTVGVASTAIALAMLPMQSGGMPYVWVSYGPTFTMLGLAVLALGFFSAWLSVPGQN